MNIENIDRKSGYITLTLCTEEMRDLTNLLFHARVRKEDANQMSSSEYNLNSNVIMAYSLLKNGMLPEFELEQIVNFRNKAKGVL